MKLSEHVVLPNIRKFFMPDPGYMICDSDLDRADLQVVVWEADDKELKYALRMGVDLHIMNGCMIKDIDIPVDELIETHPNYPEHKARYAKERRFAKTFVHGTNYYGQPKTMAAVCGLTIHETDKAQAKWFSLHPGIKRWHLRTEMQLQTTRTVYNKFGFRRIYFDRVEGLLPEALAWVPQSTVALYIDKVWNAVVQQLKDIHILLQVHDSLVWQAPIAVFSQRKTQFKEIASTIIVPYEDPLIIPIGFKSSSVSWGDCK